MENVEEKNTIDFFILYKGAQICFAFMCLEQLYPSMLVYRQFAWNQVDFYHSDAFELCLSLFLCLC